MSRPVRRLLPGLLAATALAVLPAVAPAAEAPAPTDPRPSATPDRVALVPTAGSTGRQAFSWRTSEGQRSGRVQVEPEGGGPARTATADSDRTVGFDTWSSRSRHHFATVGGLAPGTAYRYRVGDEGHWSPWRTFRTAAADEARRPWEFLYFGDAQNDVYEKWSPVVDLAFRTVPDARLALHAGDLINNADQDLQWSEWFAAMAGHADRIPQLTTPGNHEYSGDRLLQQYRAHFPCAGAVQGPLSSFAYDAGGVRFVSIDANDPVPWLTGQLGFAEKQLRANPHRWSVLTFHQPVFSNGEGRDEPNLRANWRPLIERLNVDLVLMGHDHTYGRGFSNGTRTATPGVTNGPVYVTSNSGPKHYELTPDSDNVWTRNDATRVLGLQQTSTFQRITVEPERLVYRSYVGAKGERTSTAVPVGEVVDAFTIERSGGAKRVVEGAPALAHPAPAPPAGPAARTASARWRSGRVLVRDGSLRLRVAATGRGRLTVTGRERARPRRAALTTVRRRVSRAGIQALVLRPTAAARRVLRREGRLAIRVRVTFRPAAGGRTTTVARTVVLRLRAAR